MMKYVAFALAALLITASAVEAQETITGKVADVNVKERTLTITGDKRGQKRTFYVNPEAQISRHGEPATLRGLLRGDWVSVSVRGTTVVNENEIPTIVKLRAPEKPVAPPVAVEQSKPKPTPPASSTTVAQALPPVLPKTASPIGLIGAVGTGMLALAGALGFIGRRRTRRSR